MITLVVLLVQTLAKPACLALERLEGFFITAAGRLQLGRLEGFFITATARLHWFASIFFTGRSTPGRLNASRCPRPTRTVIGACATLQAGSTDWCITRVTHSPRHMAYTVGAGLYLALSCDMMLRISQNLHTRSALVRV